MDFKLEWTLADASYIGQNLGSISYVLLNNNKIFPIKYVKVGMQLT